MPESSSQLSAAGTVESTHSDISSYRVKTILCLLHQLQHDIGRFIQTACLKEQPLPLLRSANKDVLQADLTDGQTLARFRDRILLIYEGHSMVVGIRYWFCEDDVTEDTYALGVEAGKEFEAKRNNGNVDELWASVLTANIASSSAHTPTCYYVESSNEQRAFISMRFEGVNIGQVHLAVFGGRMPLIKLRDPDDAESEQPR